MLTQKNTLINAGKWIVVYPYFSEIQYLLLETIPQVDKGGWGGHPSLVAEISTPSFFGPW